MADKILGLVAVRLKSSRLPRKALCDLTGKPLILRLTERLATSRRMDEVVWCTSTNPQDDALEDLARANGIPLFRGNELDVMSRFVAVARDRDARTVVRITGDNPLTDPYVIDGMLDDHHAVAAEYTYVGDGDMPRGTRGEVIDRQALERCHQLVNDPDASEYMTLMLRRPDRFKVHRHRPDSSLASNFRLTCDTPEDLSVLRAIYEHFNGTPPGLAEVVAWLKQHPEILSLNAAVQSRELDDSINVSLKGD